MDQLELMKSRHSVRQYKDIPVGEEARQALQYCVAECNQESGLQMQLFFDEPDCFRSGMAHYGKFRGVQNYIALVGSKSKDLEERCGYYGERLVLRAQELGLNTCWVALTYGKRKCKAAVGRGEKLVCVIALGYGETQGVPHTSKPFAALCGSTGRQPDWFDRGMEAARLAPTAMNQQKFRISLENGAACAVCGSGFYTKLDLGIVQYSFEAASGHPLRSTASSQKKAGSAD